MPMPTIADTLKYANLQMAAEALYGFDANVTPNQTPGEKRSNIPLSVENLTTGNRHASKFTQSEAEHVSADSADANTGNGTSPNDKAPGKNQPLLYKALITLKAMQLEMDGSKFLLSAGMQSNAEILLGTRTVAEYLLSPVRKAWHEAGRER